MVGEKFHIQNHKQTKYQELYISSQENACQLPYYQTWKQLVLLISSLNLNSSTVEAPLRIIASPHAHLIMYPHSFIMHVQGRYYSARVP